MTEFGSTGASHREPIFFVPGVVVVLVGVLLAIHGGLTYLGATAEDAAYQDWAFIPGRLTLAIWPGRFADLLARVNDSPAALEQAMLIRHFGVLNGGPKVWTLVSYAFLHGSWTHVGVNCVWLVAFGPPIARRFGVLRFLLFFIVAAIAGALAHWAYSPMDFAPLIGASAADSALMAAAARFIFQPGAPLGGPQGYSAALSGQVTEAPAASLFELLSQRRALVFIGIWMVTNFVFGAGAQTLGASEAPVAWVAHVGGFLAGLLLFPLFDRRAIVAHTPR
jgi:membrane associated rhomboid family serine protease